ncbi:MAG TPA: MBOAT family protein [Candidatus Faecousia intestinigallinarum]|nr:MBOAT family protein [Candidatus Faecousia intestinigallinarum]
MEFANLVFLYLFLPIVLLVYHLMPGIKKRNTVLLVASLLFYAMGQPVYLGLIVLLSYVNFLLGLSVEKGKFRTLLLPVALNVAVLALFKYLDFFLGIFGLVSNDGGFLLSMIKSLTNGLNHIGFSFVEPTTALPIGLSFYTFQVIAYMVDIYRGESEPESYFKEFLLYLTLFPKLVQGPIARYSHIGYQLTERKTNYRMVFDGAQRFAIGLGKKVLLADYCGKVVADLAVSQSDGNLIGAWFSALMFFFQIYFDFSGYTDMAIGLGMTFGFRLPENFNLPYTSKSITEFWRRWHITLGAFFRDYVYIPLGGNRKGRPRQILNMLAVWLLTGLWHGAGWSFVLWGLYFFALLSVEKQIMPRLETWKGWLRHLTTMILVIVGWVIFSHTDIASLGKALGAMIGIGGVWAPGLGTRLLNSLPLMLVCFVGITPIPRMLGSIWSGLLGMQKKGKQASVITPGRVVYLLSVFGFICLLLWLCTVSLVGASSAPSIYAGF